ncbi:MAG: DUF4136 domain-containing protein [Pseudohongiellaceae bacterium]|nr:DUF4136 domain-containing protein [Pseudohongiellaceae bacterium]
MKTLQHFKFMAIALTLFLSACGSYSGLRISNDVTLCCPGDYAAYDSFAVETIELPVFLRGYVSEAFTQAFSERGMTLNENASDLIVKLSYRHVSLDADQQEIDPFMRMESMNVELHYIANIDIEMRERQGGEVVWGGTISRIHSVQPGEYMHEGPATDAFLQTFRDLLTQYPSRLDD